MPRRLLSGFFLVMAPVLGGVETEIPEWCRELPRPAYGSLERVLKSDPWFEVFRVRPGVFAIYEPHQLEEVISFLIIGTRRALLLDTGMGIASIRKTVSRLTPLPVIVLNTHTHPDHIGGNWEFQDVWAVDTDYTRANSEGYADPAMKEWVRPPNICGHLPVGFTADQYKIPGFKITRYVKDREEIDLGGRSVQVLLTPGHTPDAICLYDANQKLLFTGDSYYPGPIYLYSKETDLSAYVRSVERIAALSEKLEALLPSHNVPVASPDVLAKLLEAARHVKSGAPNFELKDGLREYRFEGFTMLLAP